jgi:hypothetical protein
MMPSRVKSLTDPPCSFTAQAIIVDRRYQRERAFLAQPLGIEVKPTVSANRTVTWRRSPEGGSGGVEAVSLTPEALSR